jgi:hypothetical protein
MDFKIEDIKKYEWMWRHNGQLPDGERMSLKDAISTMTAPMLLPKVIQNIVKEAAEPLLIGTSLLNRINYHFGQTITIGATGALTAADIAEGMEYPEVSPSWATGAVTASIGKSGLAVKITEEMIKYSQYDIIGMMLRMAGRALARHKEQKIFNMISQLGVSIYDNVTPTSSLLGVTHGRGLNGNANGSVIMDDVFDAYAHILHQGFTPNTILMHPLAWVIWIKDPILRSFALASGGGTFFATHRGNPAGQAPWSNSSQGGQGAGVGQNIVPGENAASLAADDLNAYPQTIDSRAEIPSYFPYPLTILVSPFVPFDPRRRLTDIYIFDRNELGLLIVDEDISTDEFKDPRNDITKIKLKERYGMTILNEGQAVGLIRNVKVVPNEITLPAQTTIDAGVSGSMGPIGSTDTIPGL